MTAPVSTDGDVEAYVEMFLRPVNTGVYDWVTAPAPMRAGDLLITDGNSDLNDQAGVPNRCMFRLHDPGGDFNRKNPMGAYFGSVGLGVQLRSGVLSVDDSFARAETNTWGAVGNAAGDAWTNGSSAGGSVSATDWTVQGGSARHLLPVADSYRVSELSKTTRLYRNVEVRVRVKVPTNSITGTAGMSTDIYLRTVDLNNATYVSVLYFTDESIRVSILDRVAGTARILSSFVTIPGLNLATTGVDYDIRCQIESGTVRAKVWQAGQPEPVGWQITGYGATPRAGYVGIVSTCIAGNTNAPIAYQYDQVQVRIPTFAGEVTDLKTTGDDLTEPKITAVEAAGLMDRLQSSAAPAESPMRRSRSRSRRWLFLGTRGAAATAGDARTFTTPTASLGGVTVGDVFYLFTSRRKEDTFFTVINTTVVGANTVLQFSPDAREPVASGDNAAVYRGLVQTQQPVAYWPCEDEANSTQVSSGLPGGPPLSISGGPPKFASESGFAASKPILKVNDADLRALIPEYSTTATAISINFLLSMPSTDEPATGQDLLQFYTSGTGWSYDLQYEAAGGGSFQLLVFNTAGAILFDSGTIDFGLRDAKQLVSLILEQVGGTVTYRLFAIKEDSGIVGGVGPATITGVTTLGKVTDLRINGGGGYKEVGIGHITVTPGIWDVLAVTDEFGGYEGDFALRRYRRLAFEEGIPLTVRDDWDVLSTSVGLQKVATVSNLLKEPATSDSGFLHGCRGAAALEYITRGALTNQPAKATLAARDCMDPELLLDYTKIANRVTVARDGGTSITVEKTTGPLSTQDAPDGVGLRDTSYRLSLGGDNQVADHAYWRLGLGTLDQYRVPSVTITSAGTSTVSLETLLSIGIGDRIDITGLARLDVYDDLQQLVVGVRIRLGDRFFPRVEFTCVPYDIFRTLAITGDQYARPDGTDTTTGTTLTTTQTGSLTLVSASGSYPWTVDPADFPLDLMLAGERVTVSSIVDTATTGVQTATIIARSVNGVVKSHSTGEEVTLVEPNYWQYR